MRLAFLVIVPFFFPSILLQQSWNTVTCSRQVQVVLRSLPGVFVFFFFFFFFFFSPPIPRWFFLPPSKRQDSRDRSLRSAPFSAFEGVPLFSLERAASLRRRKRLSPRRLRRLVPFVLIHRPPADSLFFREIDLSSLLLQKNRPSSRSSSLSYLSQSRLTPRSLLSPPKVRSIFCRARTFRPRLFFVDSTVDAPPCV